MSEWGLPLTFDKLNIHSASQLTGVDQRRHKTTYWWRRLSPRFPPSEIGRDAYQFAEKVNFLRLIKNAQTQVELCEIPFAGAPPSTSSG